MTDDDDLTMILHLANHPDSGEQLVRTVVNHCFAIGYQNALRPDVVALIALGNVVSVLRELSDVEWDEACMRIATLLEHQSHEEAA